MPTFETFIKLIWDKRDWLQYSAALRQQNFSSSLEMKFPFWQNNHFGNTSCPLLRPSSRHFRVTGARLQSSACLWQQTVSSSIEMRFPFSQNNHFGNTSWVLLKVVWDKWLLPCLYCSAPVSSKAQKKLVKVVKSCNNVLSNWLFCQNGKIIF